MSQDELHHFDPVDPRWIPGGSQDEPRSLGTVIRLLGQEARVPISRVILMTARIGARIKISQKEEPSVTDDFRDKIIRHLLGIYPPYI